MSHSLGQKHDASVSPLTRPTSPKRGNGVKYAVIGTLAGLTVCEGIREQEQTGNSFAARGLFAMPTEWISYMPQTQSSIQIPQFGPVNVSILNLLRLVSLVGVLVIFLGQPSWFERKLPENGGKGAAASSSPVNLG